MRFQAVVVVHDNVFWVLTVYSRWIFNSAFEESAPPSLTVASREISFENSFIYYMTTRRHVGEDSNHEKSSHFIQDNTLRSPEFTKLSKFCWISWCVDIRGFAGTSDAAWFMTGHLKDVINHQEHDKLPQAAVIRRSVRSVRNLISSPICSTGRRVGPTIIYTRLFDLCCWNTALNTHEPKPGFKRHGKV
jgi:hypothetical protein